MADGCGYRNSYTRCKSGWVYMPDGMGCVQSELCPKCDGEGVVECQKTLNEIKTNMDAAGANPLKTANASNAEKNSNRGANTTGFVRIANATRSQFLQSQQRCFQNE